MADTSAAPTPTTHLGHLLARGERQPPGFGALVAAPAGTDTAAGPATPASGAAAAPDIGRMPGALPVEWEVVQTLREQVADDLNGLKQQAAADGRALTADDERAAARSRVQRRVAHWATERALTHPALTRTEQEALRVAVLDALFLAGPLQRLLESPDVEDVLIDGRWMYVDYANRPRERHASPWADDEAARAWVNEMARQSGHGERQLSPASPAVNFRLPGGQRVAATLLTTRLVVAIRAHRVQGAGLPELVRWGTVDEVLAQFLSAAVRARLNILIAGEMGAGKTTLLRALGRQIPARERLATIETDRELYLDDDGQGPQQGPHVLAFEARESNGERDLGGRLAGEVSIEDIVPATLRYSANRVIVGEVRSREAVSMLEVMAAGGSGSMCTIHARDPHDVIERLMVPLSRAGLSDDAAYRLIASSLDLIVYIDTIDERDQGGRVHRFVSHVWEVTGRGEGGGVALGRLFAPATGTGQQVVDPRGVCWAPPTPRRMAKLVRSRFDPGWLQLPGGRWPALETVVPL